MFVKAKISLINTFCEISKIVSRGIEKTNKKLDQLNKFIQDSGLHQSQVVYQYYLNELEKLADTANVAKNKIQVRIMYIDSNKQEYVSLESLLNKTHLPQNIILDDAEFEETKKRIEYLAKNIEIMKCHFSFIGINKNISPIIKERYLKLNDILNKLPMPKEDKNFTLKDEAISPIIVKQYKKLDETLGEMIEPIDKQNKYDDQITDVNSGPVR